MCKISPTYQLKWTNNLNLQEVVRVWFCNRRQKEKRINPPPNILGTSLLSPSPVVNLQQLQAQALASAAASTFTTTAATVNTPIIISTPSTTARSSAITSLSQEQVRCCINREV